MPVYHSKLNEANGTDICNTKVLPLHTKVKGPAPPCPEGTEDIVGEAIKFHRANVLFRAFEQEGPADITLAYLSVYIGECLRVFMKWKTKAEGKKNITHISHSNNFAIPGEQGFVLPGFFSSPATSSESGTFRTYFRQLREETAERLVDIVYNEDGTLNKWWMMFSKRKFMNIAAC